MDRKIVTLGLVGLALLVMFVSYFFLSAPWGNPPEAESESNPSIPFAPALFILGVIMLFLAPVVYELLPTTADENKG